MSFSYIAFIQRVKQPIDSVFLSERILVFTNINTMYLHTNYVNKLVLYKDLFSLIPQNSFHGLGLFDIENEKS